MGKIRTTHRGGARYYVPDDRPEIKYPGVTSVVGMLPKPFLAPWNAKLTAELAVDSLDYIGAMAERDREGAIDYLKGAARRYTKARADLGSKAHDAFERLMNGERVDYPHPDIKRHVEFFKEFMSEARPELVMAEDIAWSDTHQYAGSADAVLRVRVAEDGEGGYTLAGDREDYTVATMLVDYKTSKEAYPDVALQLAAYAHADHFVNPAGEPYPVPEMDGAAVLHITESGWVYKPVDVGDRVFAEFLRLRETFNWDHEGSKSVFGKPLAKRSAKMQTGTQRRES